MTDPSKPPAGRRMKARAPPPPRAPQPAPRNIFKQPDGGGTPGPEAEENTPRPAVDLNLTLPGGYRTSVTEDGSKALMDLLVELCSRYHLNPSLHTLELLSPDGQPLGFKPNAPLGSLDVACVVIKEKVSEEKAGRRPTPKVPEKSVRLMVNYHGSQKAVLRVNPLVPLQALAPVICDKCEFDPAHVLLLRDNVSRRALPLDKTLDELGIKELYAHDKSLDSLRSSTTSLARAEKKGLLGLFQFNRKKSKTETTSVDMDDCDDRVIQITDTQSNAPPRVSSIDDQSDALESDMSVPRTSPASQMKKRRAPVAPQTQTATMGQTSYEDSQRKRKAPAPPPTPASITPGSDDTPSSASLGADGYATDPPTPASCTAVRPVPSGAVAMQTVKPRAVNRAAAPPPTATPQTADSPTPSSNSSTADSLAVQDSSSEFSRSLDDSDLDLDQSGSRCSTLTTTPTSAASGSVPVQAASGKSSIFAATKASERSSREVTSASSSRSESESVLNLQLEEVENNRHSGMAWLHSMRSPGAGGQKAGRDALKEEETASLGGSSSGGSSLPDQGYAASEGMAEADDSGLVGSPSDTQPTSPDGRSSLEGSGGGGGGGGGKTGPVLDNSSDSDEGCATWGSRHRRSDIGQRAKTDRFKEKHKDDSTMADVDVGLADHMHIVSVKETPYALSGDGNDVPVSVVDMDVPVTAIDEVLEEYDSNPGEMEAKSLTETESAGSKGLHEQASTKPQNKNNNARTAADSGSSSGGNTRQPQAEQHRKPLVNKSTGDEDKEKKSKTKAKAASIAETNGVKEDKQRPTSAFKSTVDPKKPSKSPEIKPHSVKGNAQFVHEQTPVPTAASQRPASTGRVHQNHSSSHVSHSKITHNATSRFGMKTFTVVPPKPSVAHAATGDSASAASAIKLDDQGNMVRVGISHSGVGGPSEAERIGGKGSPLVGKAKAFWSSRPEGQPDGAAPHNIGLLSKAKENTEGPRSSPFPISGTTWRTANTEELQTVKNKQFPPAERAQPKEETKETSSMHVEKKSEQPSHRPAVLAPHLPDPKRDLTFLTQSRRTSSHYVASAINKQAPRTSAKPNYTSDAPDPAAKTQAVGFQRAGRSIHVNPNQPSRSTMSDNKEKESASKPQPSGPKRSTSYPEHALDSARDFGKGRPDRGELGSTKGSPYRLETEAAKFKHIQSTGPSQINRAANNYREKTQHSRPRSPSPAQSSPPRSTAKPHTASKTSVPSNTKVTDKAVADRTAHEGPQPSDTGDASQPVTVFGPVKKFRPVIVRSVEKESSLHGSLMEAIQTGGGRDRLKKISTSSYMKKQLYVEEQNDKSALLAAIRAQSSSGRLRKTKSGASDELEKFRGAASEEGRRTGPPTSPSSPGVFTPSPTAAPAPPPVLLQGKPGTVGHPSANPAVNPAVAREAMMEAIRSGSATERLKKVAVPKKTIQVNGRLGTIQTTSSALPSDLQGRETRKSPKL